MGSRSRAAAVSGSVSRSDKSDKKRVSGTAVDRSELERSATRDRLKLYAWAAGLTAVMVTAMFMAKGIYPFGDNVLRYTGDGAQYFAAFAHMQRALLNDENILFSWSTVLGGNMIGIFAYYAASPFNLLSALFPDNLMAAYHVVLALKYISAAVCFAVMLRNVFPETDDKAILLFSVSYPFVGFMTHFAWNQSWMDGIILLPLVLLGIWQIVYHRKPVLYTVALSLTLLTNYYIGYMVCLASVLLFATVLVLSRPKNTVEAVKACVWYVSATVIAAALAAFLLLPTYYALPQDRSKSVLDLVGDISYVTMPEDTVSMLFTAPYNGFTWRDDYPVIFTGIVQLVLVVLFFLNGEISRRYKVAAAILLTVFAVSFAISLPNTVWHAFSRTMGYNHRYAFLVSFVLEIVAFYSFVHVHGAKTKLLLAGGLLAGITLIALSTERDNIGTGTLLLDVIMICAVLALLYAYAGAESAGNRRRQSVLFAAIASIVACNLLVNSYLSLNRIHSSNTMTTYRETRSTDQKIAGIIDDPGFYRMAVTWRYGSCDPLRVGYAGVENFASAENEEALAAASRLGLSSSRSRADYDDNVPLSSDALLGLRYVATENQHKAEHYTEMGEIEDPHLFVYENPYALPVLFPGESRYTSSDDAELDKFQYMNECWNSISSNGGDIFEIIDVSREDTPTDEGYDMRLSFTAPHDGSVYAYLPKGDVTVDNPVGKRKDEQNVYYVGTYSAGAQGELVAHAKKGYDPGSDIVFYSEDVDALAAKSADVLSHDMQVEKVSGSELAVRYTANEDGFVTSTIPYDEGWHVYVDGEEVETYRNMDTFLTFDVAKGEHEISLIYWPPYFWAGVWISVVTLAAVVAYVYWERRKERTMPAISNVAAKRRSSGKRRGKERADKKARTA